MFVEDQPLTLAAAVDAHVEALDHLPGTVLEHTPGLKLAVEVVTQLEIRLLTGIITYLRAGTPGQHTQQT